MQQRDPIALDDRRCKGAPERATVPGMRFGRAPDVEMDKLMKEGLKNVARPDSGVSRDRKSKLAGNGKAETDGALPGPSYLEQGPL